MSVIIPAYNVEPYINAAIESVLKQSYENYELIVVDDGSTDETWSVIQKYAGNEKVIACSKSNGGVSSARNYALNVASGDYVVFLDSDDWLEADALEKLTGALSQRDDISLVMCTCYYARVDESGMLVRVRQDVDEQSEIVSCASILPRIGKGGKYRLRSSCFKLYSRAIIEGNHLRFDETLSHGEDGLFTFQFLLNGGLAVYVNNALWNILEREGSATTSPFSEAWLTALNSIDLMIRSIPVGEKELREVLELYAIERSIDLDIIGIKCGTITPSDRMRLKKTRSLHGDLFKKLSIKRMIQLCLLDRAPLFILRMLFK